MGWSIYKDSISVANCLYLTFYMDVPLKRSQEAKKMKYTFAEEEPEESEETEDEEFEDEEW